MTEREERPPGHSVSRSSAVQPHRRASENDHEGVPKEWLSDFEGTEAARRLERLVADNDLVTRLALSGYSGKEYDYFETELVKYGVDVITGWLVKGIIYEKYRLRGYGGLPAPPDSLREDRDLMIELAYETVGIANRRFRDDVLMRNRWDPRRGASLKTFFIGQCLMRFANVYRAWHAAEVRQHRAIRETALLEVAPRLHSSLDGPEASAVDQAEVRRLVAAVADPRVRTALVLAASGWPQAEIAQRLDVSEKAVERMLANNRDRLRRLGVA